MTPTGATAAKGNDDMAGAGIENRLPAIRLPAKTTFAALIAGLLFGWLLAESPAAEPVLAVAGPVGTLWLRGLQMTIVPLVAALLVMGIVRMVATARAGPMARRTLLTFLAVLFTGTLFAALAMPALLAAWPIPAGAGGALLGPAEAEQVVPGLGAFLESLVAPNIIAAAAETAMLPVIVFFAAFAVALTRLPEPRRAPLVALFEGLAEVMLVIIGWVLWLAPAGVFALAIGVAVRGGSGAFAALGHYILLVTGLGVVVLVAAYALAAFGGRVGLGRFARALLPVQALAISTQSSLICLPAMLSACRALKVRESSAEFVLPLAVALFRATGPVMNLGVAIYVAQLAGVELTAGTIAIGVAVAMVTTIGSVSLPGAISFVAAIGPIALAMGAPVAPLALLVAVEMIPDIMRTLGNVTMNVAVAGTVDRSANGAQSGENGSQVQPT